MGKLAVVLAEDNYEDLELHYPRLRLIEAGFTVKVAGPKKDSVYKSKFGYWAKSDSVFSDIDPNEVKVLVIPGGWAPDRLRRYEECTDFVRKCYEAGAIVGHICHAASVAISAKILKGVRTTSFPAIKDDVINAGAEWVDERCTVDKRIVGAQVPEDLPLFMKAILDQCS
eukprot:Sspe_Gene.12649::Locus_4316_Transcript_1_1_Confidence_1.000_Length_633::g.12649::m.12649/K05520/pfpI; protease I